MVLPAAGKGIGARTIPSDMTDVADRVARAGSPPLVVPLALHGSTVRPMSAERMLIYNLLLYGLGGMIVPFIGIKAIDLILARVL